MDPIFVYRSSETAPSEGRLRGLRIAIQPNLSMRGWPTGAGSKALAGYAALEDATAARRLREAGAYLCGSTHMSEFGLGLEGSRAGAALQAGAADAELVLDLMGESRVAAACAGVWALKPSYGLVSRAGLVGLIPSMECTAILSRSPETIRRVLGTIAGEDDLDFSLPIGPPPDLSPRPLDPGATTIGFVREVLESLPSEQREDFAHVLAALKGAGFPVLELSLPDYPLFSLVHKVAGSVEASSAAGRYDSVRYGQRAPGAKNWNDMYLTSRGAAFGPLIKGYLLRGAYFQFERYDAFEKACRIRARLVEETERLASQAGTLAFPLTAGNQRAQVPVDPNPLPALYDGFESTLFANVTGQPALFVPLPPGKAPRRSAGFQLVGPRLSDGRLLALGELLFGGSLSAALGRGRE